MGLLVFEVFLVDCHHVFEGLGIVTEVVLLAGSEEGNESYRSRGESSCSSSAICRGNKFDKIRLFILKDISV